MSKDETCKSFRQFLLDCIDECEEARARSVENGEKQRAEQYMMRIHETHLHLKYLDTVIKPQLENLKTREAGSVFDYGVDESMRILGLNKEKEGEEE